MVLAWCWNQSWWQCSCGNLSISLTQFPQENLFVFHLWNYLKKNNGIGRYDLWNHLFWNSLQFQWKLTHFVLIIPKRKNTARNGFWRGHESTGGNIAFQSFKIFHETVSINEENIFLKKINIVGLQFANLWYFPPVLSVTIY